jgi:DNA-binding NarL/FixJ family response regulator
MQVPNMMNMKRILLVDDHPLIRKGLRLTLESENDFMVCGEAGAADEALAIVPELDPDIIILDISLPGASGLEVLRQLEGTNTKGLVLVVSRHDEILYAERAIRAGARGYVMKSEPPGALVEAIRKVLSGGIHVSPAINERLLQGIAAGQQSFNQSPAEALSTRELEVFEMTGRGMGTREIADRLELSIKTVESYRARIKMKLNLANAAELVQHAVQWSESGSTY